MFMCYRRSASFFFSSRRRHTILQGDWSSDVCSSDLLGVWRLRRLDAGAAAKPFVMPAGRVLPWVAAGLIVALLARATAQAWLLTGGVMAAASVAFLVRRGSLQPSGRASHPTS